MKIVFAWSRPRRTIMERCNLLSTQQLFLQKSFIVQSFKQHRHCYFRRLNQIHRSTIESDKGTFYFMWIIFRRCYCFKLSCNSFSIFKKVVLVAPQFESPNRLLLTFQNIYFYCVPSKIFEKLGLSKNKPLPYFVHLKHQTAKNSFVHHDFLN